MTAVRWRNGWQEDSAARLQGHLSAMPERLPNLAPTDLVSDAFLLLQAGSIFLRDDPNQPDPTRPVAQPPPDRPAAGIGRLPIDLHGCLSDSRQAADGYNAAGQGIFGAYHQAVAAEAGSAHVWVLALGDLERVRALHPAWPTDPPVVWPPPPELTADMGECVRTVLAKTLHAFKIGFGLWGRWETS